jgi:phosphoglycerate dehydrogenase-like enzyme
VIDQEALRAQLDSGHIACASLDVIDPEPLPAGHWAYTHSRVKLSPHTSWSSPQVMANMIQCFVDNLQAYASGGVLSGVVDRHAGY